MTPVARFFLSPRRVPPSVPLVLLVGGGVLALFLYSGDFGMLPQAGGGGDVSRTAAFSAKESASAPGEGAAAPSRQYLPGEIRTVRSGVAQAPAQERLRANEILLHANRVVSLLRGVYDAYVASLLQLANVYEREFTAPDPPQRPARAALSSSLAPPETLWTPDGTRRFREGLAGMDAAIDSLRADYMALMRYVADDSVRDDGVRGKGLIRGMRRSGAAYDKARDTVLSSLDSEAGKAEETLLRGHPLRPQIMAAKLLTERMRLAPAMLAGERPDPQILERWRRELDGMLREAAMLPCAVPGEVERRWRAFLRTAAEFPQTVATGQRAGFDDLLRRQLNTAYTRVQHAYNAFAEAVNGPEATRSGR